MNLKQLTDLENIGSLGTKVLAINASVASQLPGRDYGPADAFRHIILAAELYRRFPETYAKFHLADHEDQNNPAITYNQDTYMNEVGRLIGLQVRKTGGSFDHIRRIAEKYMEANLAHVKISDIDTWAVGGGSKASNSDFLINPQLPEVTINNLTLPGIALRHPDLWTRHPERDAPGPGQSKRMRLEETNWPDTEGKWKKRFNYDGAERYRDYDAKPRTYRNDGLEYEYSQDSDVNLKPPLTEKSTGLHKFEKIKQPNIKPIKSRDTTDTETILPRIAPQTSLIKDTAPTQIRDTFQQKADGTKAQRIFALNINHGKQAETERKIPVNKIRPLRAKDASDHVLNKLSNPFAGHFEDMSQNLELANLEEPTEEMITHNIFKPDETGKTNETKEHLLFKKNKRVALKLAKLAGRQDWLDIDID